MNADGDTFWYWSGVTIIATCVVEGIILASRYPGMDPAIEHGWAWLLVVGAVLAIAFVLYASGIMSGESSIQLAISWCCSVALVFLTAMLAVFINTRKRAPDLLERRKIDREHDAKTMMLKRL